MKITKEQLVVPFTIIIAFAVLFSVGGVVINEMTKIIYPTGPFTIEDKQIIKHHPYGIFFLTDNLYKFQFNATMGKYGWISVNQTDYDTYNIGDVYPYSGVTEVWS